MITSLVIAGVWIGLALSKKEEANKCGTEIVAWVIVYGGYSFFSAIKDLITVILVFT